MCGIVGIIGNSENKALMLNNALQVQRHRGPDGTSVEFFNDIGCFGHNRLSIIDLSQHAKQPMWDRSHRFCLSFNGEIYNFKTLRKELIRLGRTFQTESDSEVLIEAWSEWGVNTINRLVGMFAFAVWDHHQKELFLVRDRMGEKPLYYGYIDNQIGNGVVFASELKGILAQNVIEKKLSLSALNHYLKFGYTNTADCIFENIYKLSPASYLHFSYLSKKIEIKTYWHLSSFFNQKIAIPFSEAVQNLNDLLSDSISQQRIADVPLGAFLSGGIDSSTIVSKMSDQRFKKINTFSIGFYDEAYNELKQSQMVANQLGVAHFVKKVGLSLADDIVSIVNAFDEPFADTSLIPTYYLCQFARENVTVSLSGDGGDELFGGYTTYQADRHYRSMKSLPLSIRKYLVSACRFLPTSFSKVSLDYKIKQFLNGCLHEPQQAHFSWREHFSTLERNLLIKEDIKKIMMSQDNDANINWFKDVSACHYLDQAMYVDMKTWLVDDILVKVDRASMAHSLEVRAPFLDHRIVEFAASLPVEYKIKGRSGKHILKVSQHKYLPKKITYQSKKGFNSPVAQWLSGDLYNIARDVTLGSKLSNWFNTETIEDLWIAHQNRSCDNGYRLFNLFCFGLWCEKYL